MALTDDGGNGMVMPVAPINNGFGGGGDFFGGGNSWLILFLLILMCGGGWGNGFGGFGGGGELYPWMNQAGITANGFSNQANGFAIDGLRTAVSGGFGDTSLGIAGINQNICQTGAGVTNALNTGFAGVNNALCNGFAGVNTNLANGFAGVNAGMANGFNQAEIAANGRQMAQMQSDYQGQIASLERSYAAQTANTQGMNALQAQLAQCCCDNRQATADLKYTVSTENCADRTAAYQNTRDIIDSQTRGTQAILDKLCALELDGVKAQLAQAQRENIGLQNQVNMATMQASQTAQTAQILAGQAAEIDGVYNRLKSCPVGTYPVCNPLTPNTPSCGCGM